MIGVVEEFGYEMMYVCMHRRFTQVSSLDERSDLCLGVEFV